MHTNCKAHLNICRLEFALYKLIIIIIIIILKLKPQRGNELPLPFMIPYPPEAIENSLSINALRA